MSHRWFCLFLWSFLSVGVCIAQSDRRCDWTECNEEAPGKMQKAQLPVCGQEEKGLCAEECRSHFDSAYHACVKKCLSTSCVAPAPTRSPDEEDDEASCVELESADCKEECEHGSSSTSRALCRRSCLQNRCPDAKQGDLSKESADPGSLACSRCQKQEKISCRETCAVGLFNAPLGSTAGLQQLGCEKLCLMTACSKSCGSENYLP